MADKTDTATEKKEGQETDVLSQLTATLSSLQTKIEGIEEKLAKVPTSTPAPAPTPAPAKAAEPPPAAPTGRTTSEEQQKYLNDLRMYAARQTQEAARLRLAREFNVDPDDLSGDYPDEAAMRLAAKQLADISRLEKLTKETQERLDQLAAAPTPVDEEPVEDTGGTTGKKNTPVQEMDLAYEDAKDKRDVGAMLDVIYQDRRKVLGIGPAPEPKVR